MGTLCQTPPPCCETKTVKDAPAGSENLNGKYRLKESVDNKPHENCADGCVYTKGDDEYCFMNVPIAQAATIDCDATTGGPIGPETSPAGSGAQETSQGPGGEGTTGGPGGAEATTPGGAQETTPGAGGTQETTPGSGGAQETTQGPGGEGTTGMSGETTPGGGAESSPPTMSTAKPGSRKYFGKRSRGSFL